jgi:hypothetical protein
MYSERGRGVISLSECRLTFKIINLRLKSLFPRSIFPQGGHDLEVVLRFRRHICVVLLERRQESGEVDAG